MEKKEGAVHFAVVLGMLAMPRQDVVRAWSHRDRRPSSGQLGMRGAGKTT